MDKIYTDPNMENDNTEHIRGKPLSSILKAPRNPLDDLGSGNELTQDINTEKRRKSSRRVSFANTINCRVFQRDLKNSTSERENTECEADKADVVTNQREETEAVSCEITGMNTLLHAPIQALVQQTEWCDVDQAVLRASRQDTTVLFSEENTMEMTASHTALISRNLRPQQADRTEKIDFTSFLAGLNPSHGRADTSQGLGLLPDPANHPRPSLEQKEEALAVKKIDFSEFLLSLKSREKAPNPAEGPDKENVFFVPCQGSEDVAVSSEEFVYSHEPLHTCNVTQVFRGQESGMEMTKCESAGVKVPFSGVGEAPPEQLECVDVTQAFADDGMDMTTSHTAKVSFPCSSVGNQSLHFQKDSPSTELDNSALKRAFDQNLTQQDPQLCADRRAANAEDGGAPAVLRGVREEARAVSAIRGFVSSETVFRGDKTVVFSKCEDMEMTGNYTDIIYDNSTTGMGSLCHKTCERPGSTNPVLGGSRHPELGDGDIPQDVTAGDYGAAVSYKTSALELPSASDGHVENVSQAHGPAAVNAGFGSGTDLGAPRSRFHPSAQPQLVPSGGKTVIFPGEDMDLTKACAEEDGKGVDNESPTAVSTSVTCKPHFLDNRSTASSGAEQEEMEITKCHAVVIGDQSSGTTAETKQMLCKIIPRKKQNKNGIECAYSKAMGKENTEVMSIDGNIERSQAIEMNTENLQMIGRNNFQASDLSSCAKSTFLFQQQNRGVPGNVVTGTGAPLSLQSHKVFVSQPLEKNLPTPSVSCTGDRTVTFSGDQSMDITKAYPAALDVAPVNTGQESNNNNNQNNAVSKQLQNQPCPFSLRLGVDTTGQTAARESGDLNTKKQIVTPLPPSGSFTFRNKPAPSGVRGNEQPGTALGINADCQNSVRQEKAHPVRAVIKVLPTRVDPERHFPTRETLVSGEDLKPPPSADGLRAGTSQPQRGSFQLPLFGGKSVVFPSGESMDWTGSCVVMVPDYTVNVVLPQPKAAPGDPNQGGNEIKPLKKGPTMTANNQEQPVGQENSSVSGRKTLPMSSLEHFGDEKTTLFSEDADMDITRSHTVSADNRVICQRKSSDDATALISGDQTCVFPADMEITKLDPSAVNKSVGKAASQGVLSTAKRTGRKSLKGTPGEKTVLFSLSSEDNDMEMTQSHTAAIGHKIVQDEGGLHSLSSAHPVRSVMFTGNQADVGISKSFSADKTTGKVVYGEETGLPTSQVTIFAEDDMEMTKPLHVALAENPLQGWQPVPSTSTILFSSYQDAMEVTGSHSVHPGIGGDCCEERGIPAEQSGQEAAAGGKTVGFASAEDMEITKIHPAQDPQPIPAIPADKTVVFALHQDDMEITASHTVAVNNNIEGFEAHAGAQHSPQHTHAVLGSPRGHMDSSHTRDLNGEHPTKPEDQPSICSSASSASAFPNEKGATKAPSGTTPNSICSASLAEKTVDFQAPWDCDLPTGNSVPLSREQDLTQPENLQSEGATLELPGHGPVDCRQESGALESHVAFPIQGSDPLKGSPDSSGTWRSQVVKEDLSQRGDSAPDLGLAGASLVPAANEESKENEELLAEGETPPQDFQINSEQTKQPLVSDSLSPELMSILNVCSKVKDLRRKSAAFSFSQTAFPDQLPRSSAQPEDTLRLGKTTVSEANNSSDSKEQENTGLESGAAPIGMAPQDKYPGINIPLGIFQPKLPNRRNSSVSTVQDINTKSDRAEAPVPVNTGETPDNKSTRQNFSPFQFVAEEFLPVCLEEMDSNESVSSELVEKVSEEISKNQVCHQEDDLFEETKTQKAKRSLEQDKEDLQSPKKVKRDENVDVEAQGLQVTFPAVPEDQVEVDGGGEPPNLSAKSPDCPQSSASSSLDSVRADTELTIQPSSHMESQLLTDSICEDNLWEKFQSGAITVGEFFTLLQVHVLVQKPRQSHLPANCAVSAPPTPEDLIYSQYVHRPKLRIYEEDCQALSGKIDELKTYANVQDQLLVNVNRSLWEVMRTCSAEELKNFGAELNKMKSYFTKESKILAHKEKETLYSKLVQSAQEQHGKLQARIEKVDELLKEAESCLVDLESESFWDEGDEVEGGQSLQEELESLRAQEEELQRELSEMEAEDEQMLVQIDELKKAEKCFREILEKYDFTEWELTEWSEQQAVFHFLYDAVELTVVFGPPIDGDDFGVDPSRTILSLNFECFLDVEQAPPSSCLVQRLIFQFIESQGSWQEKCPTLYHLPQVLLDISLVVNRCKILGEEVEFLERWGGKFNLLETDIKDTEVKLLFSSLVAFAKFELTLSLSPNYPSAPLPFSVQTYIGNIGKEEISAVLSSVPVGHHYLWRIITLIHQNLLQAPR